MSLINSTVHMYKILKQETEVLVNLTYIIAFEKCVS